MVRIKTVYSFILSASLILNLVQDVSSFKIIKLITREDVISALASQSIITNYFVKIHNQNIKNLVLNNETFVYNDIIAKTIKKYNNTTNKTELLTYDDIMTKTYLFYFVVNTIITLILKAYLNFLKTP